MEQAQPYEVVSAARAPGVRARWKPSGEWSRLLSMVLKDSQPGWLPMPQRSRGSNPVRCQTFVRTVGREKPDRSMRT